MGLEALRQERLDRILTAAAGGRPDRVPVVLEYAGFAAHVTGAPLPRFFTDRAYSLKKFIEAWRLVSEVAEADAIHYPYIAAYDLAMLWMSKVKCPGVDLPVDVPYQVHEAELMRAEEYDDILKEPWPEYYMRFMAQRVFAGVPEEFHPWKAPQIDPMTPWAEAGVPVMGGGVVGTPFEWLCGARSLPCFISDLFTIPEKVEAVMDHIVPTMIHPAADETKAAGLPFFWVGGWRTASNFLSPKLWQRFFWPYFERLVNEVVDAGLIALLHLDSDFTRDLAHFRALPKGKCVMALDGETDIFKAKEVVGDMMCLMGDVPPAMLTLGSPDEVYDYSSRLIRELGPEGFILQSGCDIPFDAKIENVQAMVSAATGR